MRVVRVAVAVAAVVGIVGAGSPASADSASERAQQRANRAAAELSRAQTALALAEDRLSGAEVRLRSTRERLAGFEAQLQAIALQEYLRGGRQALSVFSRDINAAARGRALLRFVAGSAASSIEQTRAARTELEEVRGALGRSRAQRTAAVAGLRTERSQAVAEVERLAAVQRAAEAKRTGSSPTTAGRASSSPAARVAGVLPVKGPWTCPVQGPHSFSNDYGAPRGGGSAHQGNDILAPRGTPVVANVGGSVEQHPNRLGGLAYYLYGEDGRTYYGGHLDSFGASGRVGIGTVIGYVGNTGDASGGPTHLHFEIHEGGVAVNPYSTLTRYC